jgi:hypothetical protein
MAQLLAPMGAAEAVVSADVLMSDAYPISVW